MHLPSGPQTPSFLQMFFWIVSPMSVLKKCAQNYGDIFTLKLFSQATPLTFVSNPEALQQILTSDTKELEASGELNKVFEFLLGKNSVITISGKEHQRQRQLLLPPFHGERMRSYGEIINQITQKAISQYQINQPFNIRSLSQDITLKVIMQAVFGLNERGQRGLELQHRLSEILEQASSLWRTAAVLAPALQKIPGVSYLWDKQMLRQQKASQLIYEEIQERRENPDPSHTDILSLLMVAKDEAGQPMSDLELHDELLTLLVAGHETTATAIAWAFYWIHKIPSVRVKLLAELDHLGPEPDLTTVLKLPYLNAVCAETLRIYPVGMLTFPRVVKTPISLSGYELPVDTILIGAIYLTHHREDIYPEPDLFRPERFLEKQFSPYEYLPFGGGARRCIGLAFAQLEMKLAIAQILSNYELELINTKDVKPKRRGLVTGPNCAIQVKIKTRRLVKSSALVSKG
jgi:cytochrome P450